MAITLRKFFKTALVARTGHDDEHLSGDDTTFQLSESGDLAVHEWVKYTKRGKTYNENNRKLRQDLYDALTKKLGPLEKLPKKVRDQLKLGDFIAKKGKVTSDRPLTLRRIEAIQMVVDGFVGAPLDDKEKRKIEWELDFNVNEWPEDDPTGIETSLKTHRKDVLALCRKIFPGKLPDAATPISESYSNEYIAALTSAVSEHARDNPAAQQLLQNPKDAIAGLEKFLMSAQDIRDRVAKSFLLKTRAVLRQNAVAEVSSALLKSVKGVSGLGEVEADVLDFEVACDNIELAENDTTTTVKSKIDALKDAEIANRRAVLVEIRDSKTVKKNRALQRALIQENLVHPGLRLGELEDALALVKGLTLKPADKSEEAAAKVFADIAKKVLAKKDMGEAYLKVVALGLAHAHAKEIKALVDELPSEVRVTFADKSIHETLFKGHLKGEEKSAAEKFFRIVAGNMTYKYNHTGC